MADFSRQDLKKNELEDLILKAAELIKNNRQLFSGIALTAVAVIALTIFFFARFHAVRERADEKLAYAESYFYQGRPQDAMSVFDEIIRQYPGTDADYRARLHKASYMIETRQFDEAEKAISAAAFNAKPRQIMPLALSMLGAVQESAGKNKEAITTYNSFLDKYGENFLAPKVYESLARVYELTGAAQDAKSTYEKLATLYPGTAWAQRAQQRLGYLAGQAQKPPALPK